MHEEGTGAGYAPAADSGSRPSQRHELLLETPGSLYDDSGIHHHEHVDLTTVGIDIGSSTSHLVFSRVEIEREAQQLSSRYVVIDRTTLWRSPILLTPYRDDGAIDVDGLSAFIERAYADAGLSPAEVDTGAVILTGAALDRENARPIAELFAATGGRFVCASAGHKLEAVLAAHGSGAVALSQRSGGSVCNVDVGGATTKLSVAQSGTVVAAAAVAAGGRLLAWDDEGRLVRVERAAHALGLRLGVDLRIGATPCPELLDSLADLLVGRIVSNLPGSSPTADDGLLTDPLPDSGPADLVVFSGGVAEYLSDQPPPRFGDLSPMLAERLRRAVASGHVRGEVVPVTPSSAIRATVVGASQFTVQVSGNTVRVTNPASLPLHNLPVVTVSMPVEEGETRPMVGAPEGGPSGPNGAHRAPLAGDRLHRVLVERLRREIERHPAIGGGHGLAVGVRWSGEPTHGRLRALGGALLSVLAPAPTAEAPPPPLPTPQFPTLQSPTSQFPPRPAPTDGLSPPQEPTTTPLLVVLLDADLGRSLGRVLAGELGYSGDMVCLDGLELGTFDYVDVGAPEVPSGVVPVVVKTLLFPH